MNTTKDPSLDLIKEKSGCLEVRQLEDGTIVGVGLLLFTTAVYVGLSVEGWLHRFCFDDHGLAFSEYRCLRSGQDEPSGWIARRPQQP